jgi:hypothetical protein
MPVSNTLQSRNIFGFVLKKSQMGKNVTLKTNQAFHVLI